MQENYAKRSALCLTCSKINWKNTHRRTAAGLWLCWVIVATNICAPVSFCSLHFSLSMLDRLKTCFICNSGAQSWLPPLCQVLCTQTHAVPPLWNFKYKHQRTQEIQGQQRQTKSVGSVWNTQRFFPCVSEAVNCLWVYQLLVTYMNRKLLCGTGKREGENILQVINPGSIGPGRSGKSCLL